MDLPWEMREADMKREKKDCPLKGRMGMCAEGECFHNQKEYTIAARHPNGGVSVIAEVSHKSIKS